MPINKLNVPFVGDIPWRVNDDCGELSCLEKFRWSLGLLYDCAVIGTPFFASQFTQCARGLNDAEFFPFHLGVEFRSGSVQLFRHGNVLPIAPCGLGGAFSGCTFISPLLNFLSNGDVLPFLQSGELSFLRFGGVEWLELLGKQRFVGYIQMPAFEILCHNKICQRPFAVPILELKLLYSSKTASEYQFNEALAEAEKFRIYERIPPESPYGSIDNLLKAEIGVTREEACAKVAARAQTTPPANKPGAQPGAQPGNENAKDEKTKVDTKKYLPSKPKRDAAYWTARMADRLKKSKPCSPNQKSPSHAMRATNSHRIRLGIIYPPKPSVPKALLPRKRFAVCARTARTDLQFSRWARVVGSRFN
jgi:hypothetical protein